MAKKASVKSKTSKPAVKKKVVEVKTAKVIGKVPKKVVGKKEGAVLLKKTKSAKEIVKKDSPVEVKAKLSKIKDEPKKIVSKNEKAQLPKKEKKMIKSEVLASEAPELLEVEAVEVKTNKKTEKNETQKVKAQKVNESTEPKVVKKTKETKKQKAAKLEADQNAKWADLFEKYKVIKPVTYSMNGTFEPNQPLQHKLLGWGWVLSNENDRLEVLFKDGKKILISNYNSGN